MVKPVSGCWDHGFKPLPHIFSIRYSPVLLSSTSGLCVATASGCAPDASLWALSAVVTAEEQFPVTCLLASSSGGQATGQWSPSKPFIPQKQALWRSCKQPCGGKHERQVKEGTLTSVKEVIVLMEVGKRAWLLGPSIYNCHPSAQRGNLTSEAFR